MHVVACVCYVQDCGKTGLDPCGPAYWDNVVIDGEDNQCDSSKFKNQSPINFNSTATFTPIKELVPKGADAQLVFDAGEGCE